MEIFLRGQVSKQETQQSLFLLWPRKQIRSFLFLFVILGNFACQANQGEKQKTEILPNSSHSKEVPALVQRREPGTLSNPYVEG